LTACPFCGVEYQLSESVCQNRHHHIITLVGMGSSLTCKAEYFQALMDGATWFGTTYSSRPLVQPPVYTQPNSNSIASHWARLEATAYVGVEEVRIVCRGETATHPRQPFRGRRIRYQHYLSELAREPQAVRQVAPELVAELGEPYGRLWQLLVETYGPHFGAWVLARILGAVNQQCAELVGRALEPALEAGSSTRLGLNPGPVREIPGNVAVPPALMGYRVESDWASDYDALLVGGPR